MKISPLQPWIVRRLALETRLQHICVSYLLFLMVVARKHSLEEAARFAGCNTSLFSTFVKNHCQVAVYNLDNLSKRQAKQCAKVLKYLETNTLPWKVAIIIDATLQGRSSLHPENAKKFNNGKGFVIGHQWTNIVLIINDHLIPLPPIPYYSTQYCRDHAIAYHTEHELVVAYLDQLCLEDSIGAHDPHDVVVLADSGYDDTKSENVLASKNWHSIIS